MTWIRLVILIVSIAVLICPAWAHSPYYTFVEPLVIDGQRDLSIKILNGDGILFADPMRAVVVDGRGALLAASPLSRALVLLCVGEGSQRSCVAYDELSRMIYEPKPDLRHSKDVIEESGQPVQYPEHGMDEFGFLRREATPAETARAEFAGLIEYRGTTAIAIIWWMLFWLLVFPVAGRLIGKARRPGLASIVLRLLTASVMVVATLYLLALEPYSEFYFAFVFVSGGLLAWSVPKASRARRVA